LSAVLRSLHRNLARLQDDNNTYDRRIGGFVVHLFCRSEVSHKTCPGCHCVMDQSDPSWLLSISLVEERPIQLSDCLLASVQAETLDFNNMWGCPACLCRVCASIRHSTSLHLSGLFASHGFGGTPRSG
jgi:ubiquitin C-terminal hydrolase